MFQLLSHYVLDKEWAFNWEEYSQRDGRPYSIISATKLKYAPIIIDAVLLSNNSENNCWCSFYIWLKIPLSQIIYVRNMIQNNNMVLYILAVLSWYWCPSQHNISSQSKKFNPIVYCILQIWLDKMTHFLIINLN